MLRDREAGLTPPGPHLPEMPGQALLPLVLLVLGLLLAWLVSQAPVPAWLTALALLLACGAALLCGLLWRRQQHAASLHEARLAQQLLCQLTGSWLWQSDAQHRLLHLQPPPGADTTAWLADAGQRTVLWEFFADADADTDARGGLRQRLQAQAPLHNLLVKAPAGRPDLLARPVATAADASPLWRLRALPRLDHEGRFAGYLGVAEPGTAADTGPSAWSARLSQAAQAAQAAQAVHAAQITQVAQSAQSVLMALQTLLPSQQLAAPAEDAARDKQMRALAAEHEAFTYTISHDLRAPIRVVEGFGRILKEDYGGQLDRIGKDHLERIVSAAARMNQMIDALLSLSQLSTQPLARQPVNLSQLAGFVVEELRRATPERQVQVHIAPQLVSLGDPTLLRLVLENLLGNAWKYSARQSVAQIHFDQVLHDGKTAYRVADNGAGFDMRFADRLFGVFQRLHSASDFQGTGVGLASVRRIVRRHGGEVWADSVVGEGARFYFTLEG